VHFAHTVRDHLPAGGGYGEVVLPPVQNVVGICKQIAILILH
jgi:hypothetical protein